MKAPIFSAYTASKADTAAILSEVVELATEAAYDDPNNCPHCGGAGASYDQPDGCSGCNGSGKRKRGYWNNYGRDWDDSED